MSPRIEGVWDVVDQRLYDREPLDERRKRLFVAPLGMNGKTYAQTNTITSGHLPHPCRMVAHAIRCSLFYGTGMNQRPVPITESIWYTSVLHFVIGCKWYLTEVLYKLADPRLLIATGDETGKLPSMLRWAMVKHSTALLSRPLLILDGEPFQVNIEVACPRPDIIAEVGIEGEYYRGIQ